MLSNDIDNIMIEFIPAIDIIDGKCVRLSQGKYDSQKVYNENPVEVAKEMEAHGIRRLDRIASQTSLIIDFGGGVKSDEDLVIAFDNGAQMVTLGSIAVKQPELFCQWLEKYGEEKIILGADVKDNKIAISGWKEESTQELMPFLKNYIEKGINKVLCTDISRDGMLEGPSTPLYKDIMAAFPDIHLIASGGVSSIDDILKLHESGIPAVVVGKALYEGKISLRELSRYL